MTDHHARKNIDVPNNITSPDHHCQHCHGRYHQDDKKKSGDPQKKKEELDLKSKQRDQIFNDPSSLESQKSSTAIFKNINHSKDKAASYTNIAPNTNCMSLQGYSDILETIKRQNSNLEKIKMQMMSTRTRGERENLEMLYCVEEDILNEALVKAIIIQSKCPYERRPQLCSSMQSTSERNLWKAPSPLHSSESSSEHSPEYSPRRSAGEDRGKKTNRANVALNTSSSNCSTSIPTKWSSGETVSGGTVHESDNMFKELLGKVDNMVSCLNESKDLNNKIINLLRKGREHLNLCNQCGPSSGNCGKLENICNELRNVCDEKLKHFNEANQSNNDRQKSGAGSSSNSQGGTSSNNYSSTDEYSSFSKSNACCYCNKTVPSTSQENSCGCRPRTPNISKYTCCCPAKRKENSLRDAEKMQCECVEKDSKDIKNNKESYYDSLNVTNGLLWEIQCLQAKICELVCENEAIKCLLKEQEVQTEVFQTRHMAAKQSVEEQCVKINDLKKTNDNTTDQVNDRSESEQKKLNDTIQDQVNDRSESEQKKLNDTIQDLSKRLEEANRKLEECLAEKEKLKEQLASVSEELKMEKQKVQAQAEKENDADKLKEDVKAARRMSEELQKQDATQKEDIASLKNELADLRKEAASKLAKIKERAERQMAEACRRIEELEGELAKERANVCCAIKEKEKCYKDLECALCTAQTSQVRVKKLQQCIRALMEQMNNSNRKGCCQACSSCKD